MTATHQDIGQKSAAVTPAYRRWEMPVAVVLSFFCPGLGIAAMGVRDQISRWQMTAAALPQVAFLFLILPQFIAGSPILPLLLLAGWFVVGTISAIRTLYLLPALRNADDQRKTHYLAASGWLLYLLGMIALFTLYQRLSDLTIRPAPPGTALAPVGTSLVAIKPDYLDRYARGELIEYATAEGLRLARVLAVSGDWFAPEVKGFILNGRRYAVPAGEFKGLQTAPYLDGLNDPSSWRRTGEDITLQELVQTNPILVKRGELVVASDENLVADSHQIIQIQRIETDDVLAVPLARLDSPFSGRTALKQPEPPLHFLFSRP